MNLSDKLKIKHKGGNNMNREQAKKILPIIQAFVKGKTIEFRERGCTLWAESISPIFNFAIFEYRIKSEPKYRPFANADECWQEMLRHKPFGWVKYRKAFISLITQVSLNCVSIGKNYYFKEAREVFTFADGTPFGIKEE